MADVLLILEDDEALRSRLAAALARRGFDIVAVGSVSEALQALEADPAPQFMLSDLRLGDGNGLTAIEAFKARQPDGRAVVLTGYGSIPTAVSAAKLGAVDYLPKPADADEIVDVLRATGKTPPPAHPLDPDQARLDHILSTFQATGRNVSETARQLSMHRRTLQRILAREVL